MDIYQKANTIEIQPNGLFPETRAVKLRINPNSKRNIIEPLIDQVEKCGFNLVILDVFYEGKPIYKSSVCEKNKIAKPISSFKHYDPLQVIINYAKEKGIGVFASIDGFYGGTLKDKRYNPVWKKHNKWLARTINGKLAPPGSEKEAFYMCPTNPEVRRFLGDLVCELAEIYPIDGLFIDYFQYPLYSIKPNTSYCFCDVCKELAEKQLEMDMENLNLEANDDGYIRWTGWKQEQLTTALEYIRARLKEQRRDVPLAISVNSGYEEGVVGHLGLANWVKWVNEEIPDIVAVKSYPIESLLTYKEFIKDMEVTSEDLPMWAIYNFEDVIEFEKEIEDFSLKRIPIQGYVFNAQPPLIVDFIEYFQTNIFVEKSFMPMLFPIHSIIHYIKTAIDEAENNEEIKDFLDHILVLFETESHTLTFESLISILNNINGIIKLTRNGEIAKLNDKNNFLKTLILATKMIKLLIKEK